MRYVLGIDPGPIVGVCLIRLPGDAYTCTLCGVLDEDAMTAELRQLREERDALRVGVQAVIDDYVPRQGRASIISKSLVARRLSELLDRTSITGE